MSTQKPNQYVTLVSGWTAIGKSHIMGPQSSREVIETVCNRGWTIYSDAVLVTDKAMKLGVCKVCERKREA